MPAFETKEREPVTGDDVIVCQHIANQCECGPLHYQFENPPSKVLTGHGNYLRANWSACCQSCFATAGGQAEKIAFQTVVKWSDDYKNGKKPEAHEPMKTMAVPGEATTDWPPSEEFLKAKHAASDSADMPASNESGQQVVPPPPGVPLADDVADPRRIKEQVHAMQHGGGGLPPVEQSPPKDPSEFEDVPPQPAGEKDDDENKGVKENMPNRPGPDDKTDEDFSKRHKNKNKGK